MPVIATPFAEMDGSPQPSMEPIGRAVQMRSRSDPNLERIQLNVCEQKAMPTMQRRHSALTQANLQTYLRV